MGEAVRMVRLSDLKGWDRNPHKHPESQIATLASAIRRFGFTSYPILALYPGEEQGFINAGNGRLAALNLLYKQTPENPPQKVERAADGMWMIPVNPMFFVSKGEAEAQGLSDNWIASMPGVEDDDALLAKLLEDLGNDGIDLDGLGRDDFSIDVAEAEKDEDITGSDKPKTRSLSERFGVPPFSVLDAKQGYWQERKRAWLSIGLRSHEGRGDGASPGGSPGAATRLNNDGTTERGDGVGNRLTWVAGNRQDLDETNRKILAAGGKAGLARSFGQDLMRGEHVVGKGGIRAEHDRQSNLTGAPPTPDWATGTGTENMAPGTSIYDPVLCELGYRWFCPKGGTILDPFAGGSVRGVVAAALGFQYVGVDIREEQVEANRRQWTEIGPRYPDAPTPVWRCADSRTIPTLCPDVQADLVYSCPPYADLEVYSDKPNDLSTMNYPDFLRAYREIIAAAAGRLKNDRFAFFVVGDIRDSKGFYRNFPADTIAAFQDAGCILYNEAILLTAIGSLPLRVGKQFGSNRKLGKTHQNVLIFFKGDPKNIRDVLGDCDFGDIPNEGGDDVAGDS